MHYEEIQKRLQAFLAGEVEEDDRIVIQDHIEHCPACSGLARQYDRLTGVLKAWEPAEPPKVLYGHLKARLESRESWWRRVLTPAFVRKAALRFAEAAAIVLITLAVSGRFRKPQIAPPDEDLATINLYMTEHQEAVLQAASMESSERQPARVIIDGDDIMYYEYIDEYRRISRPGVILRGPDTVRKAGAVAPPPDLAAAKSLTLPAARAAVSFAPVAPSRIHPGYILDSITKVAGRESLHLLYTNGIDNFSVFEQPLGGARGLAAKDFREYAVYKSAAPAGGLGGQAGMTILAWKNTHVSFVLIGRVDMSRMIETAQVFSDAGKARNGFGE